MRVQFVPLQAVVRIIVKHGLPHRAVGISVRHFTCVRVYACTICASSDSAVCCSTAFAPHPVVTLVQVCFQVECACVRMCDCAVSAV